MDTGRLRRQTIALVAAYAVAMQALLLAFAPMVPTALLTGPFAILCSHDDADGTGGPPERDLPCAALCAALAHGVSGPLPPGVVAEAADFRLLIAITPTSRWVPPRIARTDPHAPRGPPLA